MPTDPHNNVRIELAIDKLTQISGDLGKMVAVHDMRIAQQEKNMSFLEETVEKRREESEVKLKDVYDTIRSEDKSILVELAKLRAEQQGNHEKYMDRIGKMEKVIWIYMGGFSVVAFAVSYGPNIIKLFVK